MRSEEPLVSVVLPVKNGEATIKNSINSVLQQSYTNLELIVVINGCSDRTQEVVESIKDDRIYIIHSEPGMVSALNAGLRCSKGSLIARQDADDIWYNDKLKKQVNFLNSNEEVDIVGTQMLCIDNNGNQELTNYPIENEICKLWLNNAMNPIGHPSVVYRKKILDKIGGYWEYFYLAEDMDLWLRCAPHYKMSNLSSVEMIYNYVPKQNYDARIPRLMSQFYGEVYRIMNEWNL